MRFFIIRHYTNRLYFFTFVIGDNCTVARVTAPYLTAPEITNVQQKYVAEPLRKHHELHNLANNHNEILFVTIAMQEFSITTDIKATPVSYTHLTLPTILRV